MKYSEEYYKLANEIADSPIPTALHPKLDELEWRKYMEEKRYLEALILQFRQDVKKEYEGVPYMYTLEFLEKYDKHFNIIEARHGI